MVTGFGLTITSISNNTFVMNEKASLIHVIYYTQYNLHVPYLATDCHLSLSMMNVTTWLAIRIRCIPDFEFSWSDKTPQHSRQSITIEDVSPNQSDARVLKQHAIRFTMEFLVKTFSSLHDLEEFIPPVEPIHPVQKYQ